MHDQEAKATLLTRLTDAPRRYLEVVWCIRSDLSTLVMSKWQSVIGMKRFGNFTSYYDGKQNC